MFCKGVAVAVDACGLHPSTFVIFIEHMIACTFRELLAEDVAEEEIVVRLMLPIFQVLGEDIDHCTIERHNKRLSVLRDVDVHHVVIEIEILDLNVHQTPLPDSCAKKEVRHHPALIFGKAALLDIWFFEKDSKLLVGIGFDVRSVNLDRLHLERLDVSFIHQKMKRGNKVTQIGIDADVILKCTFQIDHVLPVLLLGEIFDGHVRIKVFVELCIALLVVVDCSLSQVSLPAIVEILLATFLKSNTFRGAHFDLFHP